MTEEIEGGSGRPDDSSGDEQPFTENERAEADERPDGGLSPSPDPDASAQDDRVGGEGEGDMEDPLGEGESKYEIVEPPEGDEDEDGFDKIPAGPTEEVRFDGEARAPRGGRGRRRRPERTASRPEQRQEEPVPPPEVARFPLGAVLAAVVILVLLLALVLWLMKRGGGTAGPGTKGPGRPAPMAVAASRGEDAGEGTDCKYGDLTVARDVPMINPVRMCGCLPCGPRKPRPQAPFWGEIDVRC